MKNNKGNQTKKVTLVIPESAEIMDITYYWKTSNGAFTKTATTLFDVHLVDGREVDCYKFPEAEEGE